MAMISLEALRQHLIKESKNGSPTAILVAQFALFIASMFLHKTTFISKHDREGIKSALSYQIIALLLPYSKHLNRCKFLGPSCGGLKVNLVMNWAFLLLAIPLENFYEKSLASLGVVLSTAVLVIVLRVIIRPRNDFGFLGFILGAAVSIACNLYRVGYKTWVVVAICFGLFGFKFLLVQNWVEVEDDDDDENDENEVLVLPTSSSRTPQENKRISKSTIIQAFIVPGFYLYWDQDLLRSNCTSINSCSKTCLKGLAACLVILVLWFSLTAIALGLYPLLTISLVSSSNNVRIEINSSDTNLDEENVDERQMGRIEEQIEADDDRQKGRIEEKVEDGKQKGKIKDEVNDDRWKKVKIEEQIVVDDERQKGRIEEKVEDGKQKGKIKDEVKDDRWKKVKTEEKVEDGKQKKGKTEEKVEDGKQKGKLKDEVKDDRRKKGKIEEEDKVIKSKSHRTSDTLRRRHNNQSKVTASFEKILTDTDVNQRLGIPTHFMQHLPNKERGGNVYLNVLDTSSGGQFQFSYYTRSSGNPIPVFQGGWNEYRRKKGLEPGDRITFGCQDNDHGCPSYTIHAQRKIKLMGTQVWVEIK